MRQLCHPTRRGNPLKDAQPIWPQQQDLGLPYDFVAAWITRQVHSALSAVGLTAAVSRVLSEGISANVVAGFTHDRLFVRRSRRIALVVSTFGTVSTRAAPREIRAGRPAAIDRA